MYALKMPMRRPRRIARTLRMKMGVRRSVLLEKKKRAKRQGSNIVLKIVPIVYMMSDGRIASMKFIPGGGRGISSGRGAEEGGTADIVDTV
jgi:hypothetical protein